MKKYLPALLVGASFLFEIALHFNATLGFVLYTILILGILLVLPRSGKLNDEGKLIVAFLILPIMRVTELFIGLGDPLNIIVTYFVLLFLTVFYFFRFRLDFGDEKSALKFLPFSVIIGIVLGVVGRLFFSFGASLGLIFLLPIIALSEEVLFRGLLQDLSETIYGKVGSILFASALYGIFSLSIGVGFAIFMFFANIAICMVYSRNHNIWETFPINLILSLILFI